MRFGFTFLLTFILAARYGFSQTLPPTRETYMEWEDFVENYFCNDIADEELTEENREGAYRQRQLEELEQWHLHPMNLNTATREELLQLPFLGEAQADSILSYRERYRKFTTLGELQLIRGLDYKDRCYLSLFVFAGETASSQSHKWTDRLWKGKHEWIARTDIPFYERSGFSPSAGTPYYGSPVAHSMRYRYTHREGIAYGLSLQQDAGEPFGKGHNHPYDYASLYAQLTFQRNGQTSSICVGDYEVTWGEGLLLGNAIYGGHQQVVATRPKAPKTLRPHTSMTETGFMRGLAMSQKWNTHLETMIFLSRQSLDARITNDTVTSLPTSGLHRTRSELLAQDMLEETMWGARATLHGQKGHVGLGGYWLHYDHYIYPTLHDYNRFYLRGQAAGGVSADWGYSDRQWACRGECAIDRFGHLALSHLFRFTPARLPLTYSVQVRWFSPRFVAPYGHTLQASSRVQNECGLLVAAQWQPLPRWMVYGDADYARHRRPMFRASQPSNRMAAQLGVRHPVNKVWSWEATYQYRLRQQDVQEAENLMQALHMHTLHFTASCHMRSFTLTGTAHLRASYHQVEGLSWGRMISGRGNWKCLPSLQFNLFTAFFWTDNYETRLYAYEPQLHHAAGFPTFAYKGTRFIGMSRWSPHSQISLAIRYSLLHYFNRKSISSGPALIPSSTQQDLSIQVECKF